MRAMIYEPRFITVKREALKRIAKAEAEGLCLACLQPLGEGTIKRHCHERCYRATLRQVERGTTTIEKRVADGKLAGESDNKGRPPSNPVTVELRG